METCRVVVDGLVQGVCFRAWARDVGRSLKLAGWVRNLPDGRVEAFAQGPRNELEIFVGQLEIGSPLARVSNVQCFWDVSNDLLRSFEIRY